MKYTIQTHVDDEGRVCTRCLTYKPWEEFHSWKLGVNGKNAACKNCINFSNRTDWLFKKYETMQAYGGKCACCGEDELDFLQIDHINNDGAEHRKLFGEHLYRWLWKNDLPDGFQVLCANCNMSKQIRGGDECIHQRRKRENVRQD